jgi:predicted nucleotidyltransferase/plasmid stability protein
MPRTLTVRGLSDAVLDRLRARAAAGRRSLNSELLTILEAAAGSATPERSPDSPRTAGSVRERDRVYAAAGAPDLLAGLDRGALAALCRRHHIVRLDVFGSVADGSAQPWSDADVIVEFEPGRTPGFDIVRIAEALRPLFGGRRVDLYTSRELHRVRDGVTRGARTLYAAG